MQWCRGRQGRCGAVPDGQQRTVEQSNAEISVQISSFAHDIFSLPATFVRKTGLGNRWMDLLCASS